MRADFAVVLDACVLVEAAVSDLYFRLSEEPRLLLPKWTDRIWDEAEKTWIEKLGWDPTFAARRRTVATEFFPEAMISGFESRIGECTNDLEDRHVLAAAIHEKVETIVTFNVRHFTTEALAPWNIVAVKPGDYLVTLYEHDAGVVLDKVRRMANDAQRSVEEMLGRLAWSVPTFSDHLTDCLRLDVPEVRPGDWRRSRTNRS